MDPFSFIVPFSEECIWVHTIEYDDHKEYQLYWNTVTKSFKYMCFFNNALNDKTYWQVQNSCNFKVPTSVNGVSRCLQQQ